MKRIDFLGAPGVGKTTLCREVLRRRASRQWLAPDEAYLLIARHLAFTSRTSLKNISKAALTYVPGCGWAGHLLRQSTISQLEKEMLWSEREKWSRFLSRCMHRLGVYEGDPMRRLWDAEFLAYRVRDTAFFEQSKLSGLVLVEDSLSQRAGLILGGESKDQEYIFDSFQEMPPPLGAICLTASPEEIVRRILGRSAEKVILKHKGLHEDELLEQTKKELDSIKMAAEALQGCGVPVLQIDAALPASRAAAQAEDFIESLYEKHS